MKSLIKISYLDFDSFMLIILLLISALKPGELLTVFLIVYIFIALLRKRFLISKNVVGYIFPFFLLIINGFLMSLFNKEIISFIDVLRDFWFYLNPILVIIVSYFFYKNIKFNNIINIFISIGLLLSVYHIFLLLDGINQVKVLYDIRLISNGYNLVIISLCLLLFFIEKKDKNKIIYFLSTVILSISILLSFSRSSLLVLGITLIVYFFYKKNKCNKLVINKFLRYVFYILYFFILVIIISKILNFNFEFIKLNEIISSYFLKIQNSINEISTIEFDTYEKIQNNWRAYEKLRATEAYLEGNFFQILFGFGFGKQVNLGLKIKLAGQIYSSVPHIHNGYMQLVLKSGLIGALIYLTSVFYLFYKTTLLKYSPYYQKMKIFTISLILNISALTYIVNGIISYSILFEYLLLLFIFIYEILNKPHLKNKMKED